MNTDSVARVPGFGDGRADGLLAVAAGWNHVGFVCGRPAQLEMGLHVDDAVDARHLRTDVRCWDPSSFCFFADAVLVSTGAMGRIRHAQRRASGADAFGHLHGVHRAPDAFRNAGSSAIRLHPHGTRQGIVGNRHRFEARVPRRIIPVVSLTGPALAGLITGTVVVERIFVLPGLGTYFINANLNRDEPLILGIVAFISITILVCNLLVDVAYAFIDPRIRY